MTHTYAVMKISPAAYAEIRGKLEAAGYRHAIHEMRDYGAVLDMHGIALAMQPLDHAFRQHSQFPDEDLCGAVVPARDPMLFLEFCRRPNGEHPR